LSHSRLSSNSKGSTFLIVSTDGELIVFFPRWISSLYVG